MAALYADPLTLWARVLRRCKRSPSGCWSFTGAVTSQGYGCTAAGARGKTITTHRLAVIASGRAIPEGMTVDHICHDSQACPDPRECPHRRCCNPAHLAVVTQRENSGRRFRWQTHCHRGHELTGHNSAGRRECVICRREAQRTRYVKARAVESEPLPTDDPRHGTTAGYRLRCRCAQCKAANAAYQQGYQSRRLAAAWAELERAS